jgi:hypothetical protein
MLARRAAAAARAGLNGAGAGQAAPAGRAADALDGEAAEESRAGRELAALLAARLDAARRASEKLLGVLQARAAPPC